MLYIICITGQLTVQFSNITFLKLLDCLTLYHRRGKPQCSGLGYDTSTTFSLPIQSQLHKKSLQEDLQKESLKTKTYLNSTSDSTRFATQIALFNKPATMVQIHAYAYSGTRSDRLSYYTNNSLATKKELAHCLQRHTTCKVQNG